jgi:hypothetical protein
MSPNQVLKMARRHTAAIKGEGRYRNNAGLYGGLIKTTASNGFDAYQHESGARLEQKNSS